MENQDDGPPRAGACPSAGLKQISRPHGTQAIALDDRLQNQPPVLGAVDVAGAQQAALQVTELVEAEQRVIAGAAEMAVVSRALLITVSRALGAIHVEEHHQRENYRSDGRRE